MIIVNSQLTDLSKNPCLFQNITKQTKNHIKNSLKYLEGKVKPTDKILDIGQRSPLTDAISFKFGVEIDNTQGDLDTSFLIPNNEFGLIRYDIIIYSHTIEHQFNPLGTLLKLSEVLVPGGCLYIFTVDRGKLLWCKGHYHEIDSYRMELLLRRAGFKIISKYKYKIWRYWLKYLRGLRPILRLFLEYNVIYKIKIR